MESTENFSWTELLSEADKFCGYLCRISNNPYWGDSQCDADFVLSWLNEDKLFLRLAELRRLIECQEEFREKLRSLIQSDEETSSAAGGS